MKHEEMMKTIDDLRSMETYLRSEYPINKEYPVEWLMAVNRAEDALKSVDSYLGFKKYIERFEI
jgi:hypothetical protein